MPNFYPDRPYNDLPLLPPKIDLEIPSVLKACIRAHQELSKLNIAGNLIPNQSVLINSIPLLESQASSAVENIVTTTDDLFQFAEDQSESAPHEVKETLRYRTALYQGFKSLKSRPFGISTICEICSTIKEIKMDVRKTAGTALVNDRTKEKIYTPPEGEQVLRNLLTNWQNFFHHENHIDPLIQLALLHYQFEAIHPFSDGNGRTGRIINLLFLIEKGLIDTPVLYLSRFIIDHKNDYYRLLLEVTTKDAWIDWILYVVEAVRETSIWTTKRILAIKELIKESCAFIHEKAPLIYTKELVELLFIQPYIRITNLVDHKIAQRQTASKYLQKLCEIGFLVEMKMGRDRIFVNKKFLDLLKAK